MRSREEINKIIKCHPCQWTTDKITVELLLDIRELLSSKTEKTSK